MSVKLPGVRGRSNKVHNNQTKTKLNEKGFTTMAFVIIPDTGCDLTKDLRERFGIEDYTRGIMYFPDGHEEFSSLDWEKFTAEEYFTSMKGRNVLYKTASVPVGEYERVFEKYLSQGIDVLSISLSSGLSTSYNESLNVAKDMMAKYPGRTIKCVDSMRYSTALALLVIKACEKKSAGASLEETFDFIEGFKKNIHQMGFMDDLFFLTKTGRVSNFKALMGTMVGVTPLADFNAKGMSEVLTKAKGRTPAIKATIEYMKAIITDPQDQIIFVAHTLRKEHAQMLVDLIKKEFNPKEVILNDVGMACGANIGPGLCSAYFIGKPMSETMEEERALLTECVAKTKK